MKLLRAGTVVGVAISAAGCGSQCETLSRGEALQAARDAKAGMLGRSTAEYAANFQSSEPVFVKTGVETNGYAANVGFRGRDGTTLIALIEADCHIGWTAR